MRFHVKCAHVCWLFIRRPKWRRSCRRRRGGRRRCSPRRMMNTSCWPGSSWPTGEGEVTHTHTRKCAAYRGDCMLLLLLVDRINMTAGWEKQKPEQKLWHYVQPLVLVSIYVRQNCICQPSSTSWPWRKWNVYGEENLHKSPCCDEHAAELGTSTQRLILLGMFHSAVFTHFKHTSSPPSHVYVIPHPHILMSSYIVIYIHLKG